jgi:hypothetical protein
MAGFEAYRAMTKPRNITVQELTRAYGSAEAIHAAFDSPVRDDTLWEKVRAWCDEVSGLLVPYPKWKAALDTPRASLGCQEGPGTQGREQLRRVFSELAEVMKVALQELGGPAATSSGLRPASQGSEGPASPPGTPAGEKSRDDATGTTSSAFTERWRPTLSGFEAAAVMNLAQMVLPGYNGREPSAVPRVAIAMGCDALGPGTSSSTQEFRTVLAAGPTGSAGGPHCSPTRARNLDPSGW